MIRFLLGLVLALALGVMGCSETSDPGGTGGDGGAAGSAGVGGGGAGGSPSQADLEGTWEFESMEVQDMTTDCPGEIVIVPGVWFCPDGVFTFKGDGTFVAIAEPYDEEPSYRGEGTHDTVDDTLTMTYLRQGTNSEDLEPIEPPELWVVKWSVSDTTLTLVQQDYPSDLPATYTMGRR